MLYLLLYHLLVVFFGFNLFYEFFLLIFALRFLKIHFFVTVILVSCFGDPVETLSLGEMEEMGGMRCASSSSIAIGL